MRLTKLEMYGFKSFARKTEIVFDDGMQVGLRNVYYEPIDVMAAGTGNITTLEYRRAAKAKAARRAELAEEVRRNKASEDTANDTVRDMFMAMGRAHGNK